MYNIDKTYLENHAKRAFYDSLMNDVRGLGSLVSYLDGHEMNDDVRKVRDELERIIEFKKDVSMAISDWRYQ